MIYLTISFVIIVSMASIQYFIGYKVNRPVFGLIMPAVLFVLLIYQIKANIIYVGPFFIVFAACLLAGLLGAWLSGHIIQKSE